MKSAKLSEMTSAASENKFENENRSGAVELERGALARPL